MSPDQTDSPYAKDACPGPCNRKYRRAVDAYPGALRAYEFTIDLHKQALDEYQHARETWQQHTAAGLILIEPRPPAHPGEPPAEPTEYEHGNPVWCSRCAGTIRHALANLDDLASLLDSWADGHRGATSGTSVSRPKPGSRSPSSIADTLDELYGAFVEVEDQWREHRRYPRRPQRARDGRARRLTIAFFLEELHDILDNPGSVRFGLGVLAWEKRLRKLTTEEPIIQRRPARCPNDKCGRRALWARADGLTECRRCGHVMHEHEYQELVDQDDGADRPEEAISA